MIIPLEKLLLSCDLDAPKHKKRIRILRIAFNFSESMEIFVAGVALTFGKQNEFRVSNHNVSPLREKSWYLVVLVEITSSS